MVEGSTTPKDKLLKLQGKTIVQRSSQQYLLLWESGMGEGSRVSLPTTWDTAWLLHSATLVAAGCC